MSARKSATVRKAALPTRVADRLSLVALGRRNPSAVFPELKRLAASDAWQTREFAATAPTGNGRGRALNEATR